MPAASPPCSLFAAGQQIRRALCQLRRRPLNRRRCADPAGVKQPAISTDPTGSSASNAWPFSARPDQTIRTETTQLQLRALVIAHVVVLGLCRRVCTCQQVARRSR